ncbi:MAG: 4Fe-4S dicluster domain-containing protein [Thermoanaerobaculia bacterium]|nr:4Fe-4S dicluster domain-containing protein [Thermoanaerobaculia bacterium]
MSSPAQSTAPPPRLGPYLREKTGINAAACYQCGKCSAGCPMAAETTLRPHDVLRLINLDRREELLSDESIWLCLTCETCSSRCPNGCDPARLIDALREEAADRAPRRIRAFHDSFLEQIWLNGRMFELGLVLTYKLRTGTFTQDAASTLAMLRRGKLKFVPHPIDGVKDVRRIFEACEAAEE